jgi:glutamate dehydrogenase/leucine dehydrogenase
MDDAFRFADAPGPAKLVYIWRPALGLKAVVAIDNTACGPAIGGVRMAPDVSAEEAFRLARAMTFKNAAAGLPHGGARDKERLIRGFAAAIAELVVYIPGPDVGTDEVAMGWIRDETGRAVGLPRELGGIPLDEPGATGFGAAALAARGVLVLPDFIANAGGVICAPVEYQRGSETAAFAALDEKIRANTTAMPGRVQSEQMLPRDAAVALARRCIDRAMATRRWDH